MVSEDTAFRISLRIVVTVIAFAFALGGAWVALALHTRDHATHLTSQQAARLERQHEVAAAVAAQESRVVTLEARAVEAERATKALEERIDRRFDDVVRQIERIDDKLDRALRR